jgi:putative hydrolase of the HAD superfamily
MQVRTAVISNWDHSLHQILRIMNLHHRFDLVVASLEEGFEKPDPRIFIQTLEKLGVRPENAAHVGDDPTDDLNGARAVGMRAVLIDRSLRSPASPPYIASLDDLPGALGWKD